MEKTASAINATVLVPTNVLWSAELGSKLDLGRNIEGSTDIEVCIKVEAVSSGKKRKEE